MLRGLTGQRKCVKGGQVSCHSRLMSFCQIRGRSSRRGAHMLITFGTGRGRLRLDEGKLDDLKKSYSGCRFADSHQTLLLSSFQALSGETAICSLRPQYRAWARYLGMAQGCGWIAWNHCFGPRTLSSIFLPFCLYLAAIWVARTTHRSKLDWH